MSLLGGWQLGGILTLQSGFPFTVLCGPGNIQNGGGVCYPDSTGVDWQLPGQRAHADALFQHRRVRRSDPTRRPVPLRHASRAIR